jgi:hypothetical protein
MKGMVRPEAAVLPESALVLDRHVISPAPNQFTHQLARAQPFHFAGSEPGAPPGGELPAGIRVLLVRDGGARCNVIDERGLYVEIDADALRKLVSPEH